MRSSTTLLALFAITTLAISTSKPLVTIALYATPTCSSEATSTIELSADLCYPIIGAQGLKVVQHTAGLDYNACEWERRWMRSRELGGD
jgi:hypothetical protein